MTGDVQEERPTSLRLWGALCEGLCLPLVLIHSFRKLRSRWVNWYTEYKYPRHDEDLREPLVRRQGSQVSMRVTLIRD